MADSRDITGKNRKFTGTTGVKLPEGTTAQRVDEAGQLRFNTTTNLAEYYDGSGWKSIDAPPTITGFSIDGGSVGTSDNIGQQAGDATIVIQGNNFDTTSGTVVFEPEAGGSNVSVQTITRTNASSFTVTVTRSDFDTANDPYAIKLTNGSGLAATLASALVVNDLPVFTTAADTEVASEEEGASAPFSETTLAATDPEGDTITYSISAGALPPGLTINSSTAALEGTISGSSVQDYTFTVQAATAKGNATRQFVFNVAAIPFSATGGTTSTTGSYTVHTFTSSGTFTVLGDETKNIEYLVVAGGGGAGGRHGGGGGAGGMLTGTVSSVGASSNTITIGGGGSGNTGDNTRGTSGQDSSALGITSTGGGGGGGHPTIAALSGGSGGGGGFANSGASGTAGQGNPGGNAGNGGGAGGGGKGNNGGNASGGAGGSGGQSNIDGNNYYYAGGGGGGSWNVGGGGNGGIGGGGGGNNSDAPGGTGGGSARNPGGNGQQVPNNGVPTPAGNGGANTGGGGGSGEQSSFQSYVGVGGNGGTGIVILRYLT